MIFTLKMETVGSFGTPETSSGIQTYNQKIVQFVPIADLTKHST
jgi:hypothetical protein